MSEIITSKEHLSKFGFCIVKNLLSDKEIKKYSYLISELNKKYPGAELTLMEIIKEKEMLEYIFNQKLLDILKNILGPKVFWLHNLSTSHHEGQHTISTNLSWHRDSPCRRTGIGPDWDENEPYNVVAAVTYLNSYEESGSGLNVIPGSHKKTYARTFSNVLRTLHWRSKNIESLKFLRKIIQDKISINYKAGAGDCMIFLCNLFHLPLPTFGLRQAIKARFGAGGKHSKNYVNYALKHHTGFDYEMNIENKKIIDDLFELLKSKNIYFPVPEKKEDIEGALVNG